MLLSRLRGISISSERLPTLTNEVAEGLGVLDGAPSRAESDRRVAAVAAGRVRRPVLVLGSDGASVPSRPDRARGRRPGQARHRARRAPWKHEWRAAKGWRFSLLDGDRIVQVLSWHQVHSEDAVGTALQQVKDAGWMPDDTVRLCVIGDGADWIGQHGQALLPEACQGLDSSPCSEYLPKVAKAQYHAPVQACQGGEATLTRLSRGQVGRVLGGLRRMPPARDEARQAMDNGWMYRNGHRGRTNDRTDRRGGSPVGRGGMASSNQWIGHGRWKRAGAWWYEANSHRMVALRCATYNGTFDQVVAPSQHRKSDA